MILLRLPRLIDDAHLDRALRLRDIASSAGYTERFGR